MKLTFFILNFCFHIFNSVRSLHFKCYGLPCKGFYKDLHLVPNLSMMQSEKLKKKNNFHCVEYAMYNLKKIYIIEYEDILSSDFNINYFYSTEN